MLNRSFSSIKIEGDFNDTGKPVLLLANHISWWDGFWMEHLNQKLIKRRFYFMMLESQLIKHWYFRYLGGFSVKKGSREVVDSVNYTAQLLRDDGNLVLLFPQGKIHSLYNNKISFEKGISTIIEKLNEDVQILFAATFIDYLSSSKPHLNIYIKALDASCFKSVDVEMEYNLFYNRVLDRQKTVVS